MPMDEYKRKLDALDAHCAEVGRDRSEIRLQLVAQVVLGADEHEAAEQLRLRAEGLGMEPDALRERMIVGTPEQLVEHLTPYAQVGTKDFLVMARPPMDRLTLELLAREVAPAMRA
jgi:alkanesulfonate monooxygenase SsuD/methylene tetrahydromethanopterin reductase-like flavin-dependent oxidoreductase (luciferase family)